MSMVTTTIAIFTLVLMPGEVCKRCQHPVDTPIEKASAIAAKRAGMKEETEWLMALIEREHGYSVTSRSRFSRNPRSTAYGLGQFLNSTWRSVGIKKTTCQVCQIEAIYRYCHYRKEYGSIRGAVAKWDERAKRVDRYGRKFGGWY